MAEPASTQTALATSLQHQAFYRAVLDQVQDAICLIDAQSGRFIECNASAWRNLGYTSEEFMQLHITDVEAAQDAQQVIAIGEQILREGSIQLETKHRCKNGQVRDVRVSAQLVQIADRAYFAAVWSDVTEHNRDQQRLAASEAALREAQSIAQLGSWTMDIPNDRIAFSEEACRIFGIEGEVVFSLDAFLTYLHPDDRQYLARSWARALEGAFYQPEYRVMIGNEYRWVRERARIRWDTQRKAVFAVGTVQDVTEQRRMEAELNEYQNHLEDLVQRRTAELANLNRELIQARDAAEAASRAKSTFLANISHEIRTPINAVSGLAHVLERDITNQRQRKALRQIAEAARHLMEIITDILELSKIDAGKLRLENIHFALAAVLDNLHTVLSAKAKAKGLIFTQYIDPTLPGILRGDPVRLRQILLNFANNALKFTERGCITLCAQRVLQPQLAEDEVRVRFEIQDTGIGISASDQGRLFQAFEQADNSTTRKYGGTGLSLALNRRLIELMGGEFGVVSWPHVGSTFWFAITCGHDRKHKDTAVELTLTGHISPPTGSMTVDTAPAPPPPELSADSAVSNATLSAISDELLALLAEDDLRASQLFNDIAPQLRSIFGDAISEMEQYLDAFAYQQAHALLKALLAAYGEGGANQL